MSAYPDPAQACGATDVIDADDPLVVLTARDVAGGAASDAEAAERLFTYARDEIRYDMAPHLADRGDWAASATLQRGYGFCQQKAIVLAALLRARGIPAGLVFQDLLDHKIPAHYAEFLGSQRMEVHGLAIAHVDGSWQRLDPALDRALCERKGYRLVEYRAGADCVLPDSDLAGARHFDVVRELGAYADFPADIYEHTMAMEFLHAPEYQRMARRHGPQP